MLSIALKNRQNLFDRLLPSSVAILFGSKLVYRSKDVAYSFRQNSDFFYLTGFNEPNAVAVFIKGKNSTDPNRFLIFCQRADDLWKIWHGDYSSPAEIINIFGADECYYYDQLNEILVELFILHEFIYYPMLDLNYAGMVQNWYKLSRSKAKKAHQPHAWQANKDLLKIIHQLRIIKSSLELDQIRYVSEVTAKAHNHLIRYIAEPRDQLNERDLQAEFYKICLQLGCNDMAYLPIIASGTNSCILHYTKNSKIINNNELILIDAGAEYNYYAADLTRVFPANGKFSMQQQQIYNLVLYAQKTAIAAIKPGLLWQELQNIIVKILVEGLVELKILHGNVEDLIQNQAYKEFYMHNFGHFLGLDVHDVGDYYDDSGKPIKLEPGMVLTVEPGLYFHNYNARSAETSKWLGIGVRIEDDVLVTPTGAENLTVAAIKEIDEIEYLMFNYIK